MVNQKLKINKSTGIVKFQQNWLQPEVEQLLLRYLTNNSIFYKNELPQYWKESIIAPVYKKDDKTNCNNYRGTSILSTTYKILSNTLLSSLNP
jgi:hypothetical protein